MQASLLARLVKESLSGCFPSNYPELMMSSFLLNDLFLLNVHFIK